MGRHVRACVQDANYTVSIMASGRHIAKHERLTSVAFSSHKGLLAAGTEAGQILLWRQHSKKGGGAAWEPVANTSLPSGVAGLDFSGKSGLLAIRLTSGDVLVLAEASLRRKLVGNVSVLQLSSNELAIERRLPPAGAAAAASDTGGAAAAAAFAAAAAAGGKASSAAPQQALVMSLTTSMAIKGVDATAKHVLVWSGKLCEVYQIPDGPVVASPQPPRPAATEDGEEGAEGSPAAAVPTAPPLRLVASFKTAAQEMALFGDSIFAVEDSGESGVC
jgi:hypothetical protein